MTARIAALAALVLLASSARSETGSALNQAGRAADRPGAFDGARDRAASDAVVPGPSTETRSPERLAADEQAKAAERDRAALKPAIPIGADVEKPGPKPNPWLAPAHLYSGAKGALIGAIIGSFGGWLGALIGAAVGFAIAYAISKLTS